MKYNVVGKIRNKKKITKFDMEVEAKSEKHAMDIATARICSKQKLSNHMVTVESIKPAESGGE